MNAFIQKAGTHAPATQHRPALLQCLRKPFFGALLLFCLAFPAAILLGQNITPHDLSEFAYGVTPMGVNGDTLKFEFWLGTADIPAEDVAGFEVSVFVTGVPAYPPVAFACLGNSWVAAGADNLNIVNNYDPATGVLTFSYVRADEVGQTGHGVIATVCLVKPGGWTNPENAVLNVGGGLVMVDNADFKRSPTASGWGFGFGLTAFPTPADDHLEVKVDEPTGAELLLADLQGKVVKRLPCEALQTLDVSMLKPGMYVLTVLAGDRKACQRVVIR